jgi:hypothetical protein
MKRTLLHATSGTGGAELHAFPIFGISKSGNRYKST